MLSFRRPAMRWRPVPPRPLYKRGTGLKYMAEASITLRSKRATERCLGCTIRSKSSGRQAQRWYHGQTFYNPRQQGHFGLSGLRTQPNNRCFALYDHVPCRPHPGQMPLRPRLHRPIGAAALFPQDGQPGRTVFSGAGRTPFGQGIRGDSGPVPLRRQNAPRRSQCTPHRGPDRRGIPAGRSQTLQGAPGRRSPQDPRRRSGLIICFYQKKRTNLIMLRNNIKNPYNSEII